MNFDKSVFQPTSEGTDDAGNVVYNFEVDPNTDNCRLELPTYNAETSSRKKRSGDSTEYTGFSF